MEEMMAWSKAIARPVLRVAQDLRAASHEAPWPGLRNSSSGGTCYSSGYCSWGEALRKMLWKWVWLSYGAPFLTQITVWFWYDDDMMFECNWSILKCISSHEDFGWRRIDCSGKLSLLAQFAVWTFQLNLQMELKIGEIGLVGPKASTVPKASESYLGSPTRHRRLGALQSAIFGCLVRLQGFAS